MLFKWQHRDLARGGVNQCVSNTIAGISAATGQDLASVHESSWAVFDVTVERNIKVAGERL